MCHSLPDLAVLHVKESLHQHGPLHHQGGHEQGEAGGTVAIFPQEGHEEAEANEDHHLDVLELCGEKEGKRVSILAQDWPEDSE